MATDIMAGRAGLRGAVSALLSTALHVVLLVLFAATSIHIASEDRAFIPLVILEPAPPPPPPPPGPGTGNGPAAQIEAVVAPPVPVQPVVGIRKPVEKPKIAAKPKPIEKPEVVAKPKVPAAAAPPASVAAPLPSEAPAGGGVTGGVAGGTIGGTVGGVDGGLVGGRPGGTGDAIWSFDQVVVRPRAIHREQPVYPRLARQRGLSGVVIVHGVIDRSGAVEVDGLRVVQSNAALDDAALAAVRQFRFTPGRDAQGQLVRVWFEIPVRFNLPEPNNGANRQPSDAERRADRLD